MKFRYLGTAIAAVAALGMGATSPASAGNPDISVQLSWGLPVYHASHYGYAPPLVVYPAPVYQPYYGYPYRRHHAGRHYGYPPYAHYHGRRICHVQNHYRGDDGNRGGHDHGYRDD
jgi:hypothetical protein